MNRFYIYCVFWGLIVSCQVNNSISNCDLQDKIAIQFEILNDSLCFGDSVFINVKFTNKSSESIFIYPKAVVMLELTIDSSSSRLMCLNETCQDYKTVSKIGGFSSFDTVYRFRLDRSFFVSGENRICVLYRAFRQKKSAEMKNKPLVGYLNSNTHVLRICDN